METKLLIKSIRTGKTFDYTRIASEVKYVTNRTSNPGKLTITLIRNTGVELDISVGSTVIFSVDEKTVFKGYLFIIEQGRSGEIALTAYDQTRYLKAKASYLFEGMEAGDIIRKIAKDFQLKVGDIEKTGYQIPYMYKEEEGCFDIISYAIQLTIRHTGKIFVFFDDNGKLCLKEAKKMKVLQVIGSGSLLTDYSYKVDIDQETYNQVKLVRPNKKTGRADTYIATSPETIKKWGLLQYYEKVDENMNAAQIKEQAITMLEYYNRALKSLHVEALGVLGIRAGSPVYMAIPEIPESFQYTLMEKVTHTFKNGEHTMSLETRALN